MACGWQGIPTCKVYKWYQCEEPGNQQLRAMAFYKSQLSSAGCLCHLLTSAAETMSLNNIAHWNLRTEFLLRDTVMLK